MNTVLADTHVLLWAMTDPSKLTSPAEAVISDLREDRDKWRQQATALLEDKRPKGFFKRLLGK